MCVPYCHLYLQIGDCVATDFSNRAHTQHTILSIVLLGLQIVLHHRYSCILWRTSCGIILQGIGLQSHSYHVHNTVCGTFQLAECVQSIKNFITYHCSSLDSTVFIIFMVSPSLRAIHILTWPPGFIPTHCYLLHLVQQVLCHCTAARIQEKYMQRTS